MRNLYLFLVGPLFCCFLPAIIHAQSITADFNSTPSAGCASSLGCNSFTWNVSGATFVFTFNSTDATGSMQWLPAGGGVGGSGSMDVQSGDLPDYTTTEKVIITRQDGGNFNFNSIYIQNDLAQTATVQGYKNSAPVGASQTVAMSVASTLNFAGINVDKVEVSSTDFFYLSFDNFSACVTPSPSFSTNIVCLGSPTQFTDASTLVATEATYAWDFDNNNSTDNTTKGNITNTYAAAGNYTAKLTISQGSCSNSTMQQVTVQDITAAPVINAPISEGATSVSGTSTDPDGTAIVVYKAGSTQIGTATVSGGTWTATVSALLFNDVITAKATASGECQSPASAAVTVIDNTPPSLTNVHIQSNNPNNQLAKVGDQVTVSFTASETINTPNILIAGTVVTPAFSSGTWSATYQMLSSDAEGAVPFNITYSDLVGNAGTPVSTTSDNSSVTFDKTAPYVLTINRYNPSSQGTTSTTLIYRVTFSEPVIGVDAGDFTAVASIPAGQSVNPVISGSGSVYDITVNVGAINGATIRLDLNASSTGIKDLAGNDITTGFTTGQTYILGSPSDITQCQNNLTASPNAAGCTSLQSFGVTVSGAPLPDVTYKIGSVVITSPYAFPRGTTTVDVTAHNGIGMDATCSFTVTVNSTLNATIPDASAYPTGVDANTIYYGWTPAEKITYSASVSDGTTPYSSYKWTTSAAGLSIVGSSTSSSVQVTSAVPGDYTLMLEVTDANDCKKTATKTVTVVDVLCGNKLDKVMVCKKTPAGALCISASSVASQLASGNATLGACSPPPTITTRVNPNQEEGQLAMEKLSLRALPNPTNGYFSIEVKSNSTDKVMMRVYDLYGRLIEQRSLQPQSISKIGETYRPGSYLVRITQGKEHQEIKLLKLPN